MLKSLSWLWQFNLFRRGSFSMPVSMPAPPITEPLRAVYKQLFPPPQHVLSYLYCETQICVVNGHVKYKMAWPSPPQSFHHSFLFWGHKLTLPDVLHWSPCRTLLKTSLCFSCFPDVINDTNGNHMLNANTTSSTSTLSGSCDAAPLHTHTESTHNLWGRLFCFPWCLIFCTECSFVLCKPSLSVSPLFCAWSCSAIQTDTLWPCRHPTTVSCALHFVSVPYLWHQVAQIWWL